MVDGKTSAKRAQLEEARNLDASIGLPERLAVLEERVRFLEEKCGAMKDPPASGGREEPAVDAEKIPTYADALDALGGEDEIKKFAGASEDILQRSKDGELDKLIRKLLPEQFKHVADWQLANQPFVKGLDELYEKAAAVETAFREAVEGIARSTGGKPHTAPLKGRKRAQMKAQFKLREGDGVAWFNLIDLVRATIEYDTIAQVYAGLEAILAEHKQRVREVNDRYQRGLDGGYRDVLLVVEFDGFMCELQLNTGVMLTAKEGSGHGDFEVLRELESAVADGDFGRCQDVLEWKGADQVKQGAHGAERQRQDPAAAPCRRRGARRDHAPLSRIRHSGECPRRRRQHRAPPRDAQRSHASRFACAFDSRNNLTLRGETHTMLCRFVIWSLFDRRAAWALLDWKGADTTLINNKGVSALLEGCIAMRRFSDRQGVAQAVSTLLRKSGPKAAEQIDAAIVQLPGQLKPAGDLHDACSHRYLTSSCLPLLDRKLYHNSIDLCNAAADGNLDKMRDELRTFADPGSHNDDGERAVVAALRCGKFDAARVLAVAGASVATIDFATLATRDVTKKALKDGGKALVQAMWLENSFGDGIQTIDLSLMRHGTAGDLLECIAARLGGNNTLKTLISQYNSIGVEGAKMLGAVLEKNATLQTLNLEQNKIGDEGAKVLGAALEKNATLQTLLLARNSIGDEGAKVLGAALEKNATLQTLNLRYNEIGVEGGKVLGAALEKNATLQTLNLKSNEFGVEGGKVLGAALEKNATLQTLNLTDNQIGDEGGKVLGTALEKNATLQTLNLENNKIGVEGGKVLGAALEKNATLQTLNLARNSIDDEGAKVLGAALEKNATLQTLDLARNSIGDEGGKVLGAALEKNATLQTLDLRHNKIGDDGAKVLAAALEKSATLQTLDW